MPSLIHVGSFVSRIIKVGLANLVNWKYYQWTKNRRTGDEQQIISKTHFNLQFLLSKTYSKCNYTCDHIILNRLSSITMDYAQNWFAVHQLNFYAWNNYMQSCLQYHLHNACTCNCLSQHLACLIVIISIDQLQINLSATQFR